MNEINQSSCICFRSFHWLVNHDQGHARSARVHKVQWRCFITSITTTCTQRTYIAMNEVSPKYFSCYTNNVSFFALFALLWRGGWWGDVVQGVEILSIRMDTRGRIEMDGWWWGNCTRVVNNKQLACGEENALTTRVSDVATIRFDLRYKIFLPKQFGKAPVTVIVSVGCLLN